MFNIESEIQYFAAVNAGLQKVTPEMKAAYGKETISDRLERISSAVYERFAGVVQSGAFTGMTLPRQTSWQRAHAAQMILGIYEPHIVDLLYSDCVAHRRTFINVGAADGFYAVGLCYTSRMDCVHAYEINDNGRAMIAASAALNGVSDRIQIHGEATTESLLSLISDPHLNPGVALVDIEGCEFDLLSRGVLAALGDWVVIVEIHNWIDNFLERYRSFLNEATQYFSIAALPTGSVMTEPLLVLPDFPDDNRYLLLSEGRPCVMHHIILTPLCHKCE